MKEAIVMVRMTLLVLATLLSAPAFAGQPGADLQSASAFPAAADKVYPPLPTLAMLPPSSGDDDELPAKPTLHRKKARAPVHVQENKPPPVPVARLVVSDASHAYLESVQRQIDQASSR
ncbi:hypothetical protein [Paraburkholderia sp. SIMBA_030]|uniref:hypothetical protein n=1 Tax=Paraburkholderia sp. SIMBA_030 TaxID=3085773 RepID=UPI00397E347F